MDDTILTKPIQVGPSVVLGEAEGTAEPFEPADVDYAAEYRKQTRDPTAGNCQIPGAVVNSCSECCMETINGKPNLLGKMHRRMIKSCSQCPVGSAGDRIQARDGNENLLFQRMPDGSKRPVTRAQLVIMEIDGTT